MEPWLDKRETTSKKGALMLSKKTEDTLQAISALIDYSFKTRKERVFNTQTLSAIPYYMSMVSAIYGTKNAYPYYCGDNLGKDTIAVSVHINPDQILGLKEPLIRYATSFPSIIGANEDFVNQEEYGLFIFCYRTLIFVLEELLLAVSNCDIRNPLAALYDVDAAFEDFRRRMLGIAKASEKTGSKNTPSNKELIASAEQCIEALRRTSREFYIVEMLIMKTKTKQAGKRQSRPMQRMGKDKEPSVDITKENMVSFMHKLVDDDNA